MESEKVKEIKKSLEYCCDGDGLECKKCFYIDNGCNIALTQDALTLINELESENERLNKALVDNLEAYRDGFNEGVNLKIKAGNKLRPNC